MRIDRGKDSIRQRLMLTFIVTTSLATLLATTAYFAAQLVEFRSGMVENLTIMGRLIGANSIMSLERFDMAGGEKTLETLEEDAHIMAAVLYDDIGQVFASYLRHDVVDLPKPSSLGEGHTFHSGVLDLSQPIVIHGQLYGTVFIRSDTAELNRIIQVFLLIVVLVMLGSLVVCYVGASLLRNRIASPLGALVEGSASMAKGDLSVQVDVTSEDEFGTLAEAFNAMAASLRGLISQVSQNTGAVTDASAVLLRSSEAARSEAGRHEVAVEDTAVSVERINASIGDVNASVETLSGTAGETSTATVQMNASISEIAGHMDGLSETIEDTASSVVEMTVAIREIARSADELNGSAGSTAAALDLLSQAVKQVEGNAQASHEISEHAVSQAEQGVRSVEQTVQGIQQIQVSFRGLEETISDLSQQSDSIGEVVKVIEGVVEQTNLLALNAAIISSQAGEHGRAFAVVAREVRSLAERTAGSTRQISELIQAVQNGVRSAVQAMEEGNQRVETGVALSQQAGEILHAIGDSVQQSSQRIREIAEASQRQARDIERVDGAMSHVKTIAGQLNRGTHEQDTASADITRAVERMRDLGQRVKLSIQEQRKESSLISQSVEVVAARIQQILEATNEQSKQGDQILAALQVFRDVTHQSTSRSEEMRQRLEELAERSGALEEEIGRFRV
jgi:methyl-accepting chemotaxis protein